MDGVKPEAAHGWSAAEHFLRRLRWKALAVTAAASMAVYTPIIALDSDTGSILYWEALLLAFLGCFAIAFTFTITGKRRDAITLLGVAFVCTVVSISLFWNHYALRTTYRWAFHASAYKRRLFARHDSDPNGMIYMDWDGWGMAGSDTEAYLVHDPTDRLRFSSRGRYGLRAQGLACEVWKIRRLEKEWYSVVFFTNEGWGACTQASTGSR